MSDSHIGELIASVGCECEHAPDTLKEHTCLAGRAEQEWERLRARITEYEEQERGLVAEMFACMERRDTAEAEVEKLRAENKDLVSHRDGLCRLFHALAADERLLLATVDPRVQQAVDIVVAERIRLRVEVERLRKVVHGIATASYREWPEELRDAQAFKEWAQSVCRHALAALEVDRG